LTDLPEDNTLSDFINALVAIGTLMVAAAEFIPQLFTIPNNFQGFVGKNEAVRYFWKLKVIISFLLAIKYLKLPGMEFGSTNRRKWNNIFVLMR
jgi:hypothetical protein